jgi:hypothetical protein
MTSRLVTCTNCRAILPAERLEAGGWFHCDSCGSALRLEVFPALFRETVAPAVAEPVMMEGESTCFYHAAKKAVVPCDVCGRFLCALCDLEMDGQHVCPACLETGRTKGKMEKLVSQRLLPDQQAMMFALLPLLLLWPSLVGAPIALYIVIRHWHTPGSLTAKRPRLLLGVAGALAILEILGWIVAFILIAKG